MSSPYTSLSLSFCLKCFHYKLSNNQKQEDLTAVLKPTQCRQHSHAQDWSIYLITLGTDSSKTCTLSSSCLVSKSSRAHHQQYSIWSKLKVFKEYTISIIRNQSPHYSALPAPLEELVSSLSTFWECWWHPGGSGKEGCQVEGLPSHISSPQVTFSLS